MEKHSLMVQWVVGSILHIGPTKLFLIRASAPWKSIHSWCNGFLDRSFMVDPLSYFSFEPVLHGKAFTHGAMDSWIDPSWWTHWAIFHSSQCSMEKHSLMVQWIIGSILHGGPTELFFIPASAPWKNIHSWRNGSLDRSFMVDPLSYFSFQPVIHGKAFTHGAMGHRIDPSWWTHWAISHSSQVVVCTALSVGMVHIKNTHLAGNWKEMQCSGRSRFPLSLSCPLPYVWCHITINKMCWIHY